MGMSHGPRDLASRIFSELANGTATALTEALSEDVRWTLTGTSSWSKTYAGKREVTALLRAVQARCEGPMKIRATRILCDGDHVVVEARGDNVTREGARYDNAYCFVLRVDGGTIGEITEYMDTALVTRVFAPA
jgi:uncharacterized protein